MNKIEKVNKVIEAIKVAFPAHTSTFAELEDGSTDYDRIVPQTRPELLPQVMQDFDGCEYAIVWEDCSPYSWTYLFPFGGVDEEFGSRIADVSATLPEGVWVEALTSYSIAVRFEA